MMLTEEQAKEKWCPFARRTDTDDHCIASQCMAWRWFDGVSDDGTACHHTPTYHYARIPEPKEGRALIERRGHCGLAGKP